MVNNQKSTNAAYQKVDKVLLDKSKVPYYSLIIFIIIFLALKSYSLYLGFFAHDNFSIGREIFYILFYLGMLYGILKKYWIYYFSLSLVGLAILLETFQSGSVASSLGYLQLAVFAIITGLSVYLWGKLSNFAPIGKLKGNS